MQISNWLQEAIVKLNKHAITSATLDAEVLLSFVIKKPREFVLSHPEMVLTKEQIKSLEKLIDRRSKLEPIAYLTNHKEFFGLDFYVDKNVLVPRPETELLVETVIGNIESDSSVTIADIGTGSGCIAIALAKNLPKTKIFATDISKSALMVAKKNAEKHKIANQIEFKHGNLLDVLDNPVDIIIANLPYVPRSEYKKEISFEPEQALFGDYDGMEYLETIINQAPSKLTEGGIIVLEIHPPQSSEVKKIAQDYFPESNIQIKKDLAKKDRIVIAKL
jgi:release factor glutamine methyltransferase